MKSLHSPLSPLSPLSRLAHRAPSWPRARLETFPKMVKKLLVSFLTSLTRSLTPRSPSHVGTLQDQNLKSLEKTRKVSWSPPTPPPHTSMRLETFPKRLSQRDFPKETFPKIVKTFTISLFSCIVSLHSYPPPARRGRLARPTRPTRRPPACRVDRGAPRPHAATHARPTAPREPLGARRAQSRAHFPRKPHEKWVGGGVFGDHETFRVF